MTRVPNASYDPDAIKVLLAALDEAWDALPPARQAAISKETLAQRILKVAANGERDPIRLSIAALIEMVEPAK